jgi:hypothetical protein
MEFWPDYGEQGPLWSLAGEPVDLDTVPLTPSLRDRLRSWNRLYADEKLPVDGGGDGGWIEEGRLLLAEVRRALGGVEVVVHEDWWGEPGEPFAQP